MAEPNDVNVDELKRRARRRLVGAVVLALGAAVFVPMLLESDPKPLGEDVSVKIPPVDDGKFVNRLSDKGKIEPSKAPAKGEPAKVDASKSEPAKADAPRAEAGASATAKESAPKDTGAKEAAAKDAATKEPAAKESAKESSAVPPSAAKNALNDAERKVLNASAKSAPASSAPAKGAPAAPGAVAAAGAAATSTAAPAPAAAAAAMPTAAPASAAAKAEGASGFSVQLAAFADDKGANALSNKLKKAGYPAYTEPLTTSRGTLWRVRVGPFASRDAAATSRDKLKGEGYAGIVAPSN